MGAGASTATAASSVLQDIPETADANLSALADTMLPLSEITPLTKDVAVRLKLAMSTSDGWNELQGVFSAQRQNLDDVVSSAEWGAMVCHNEELRGKYFADATFEEIAQQFSSLDEAYAHARTHAASTHIVQSARSVGATHCTFLMGAAHYAHARAVRLDCAGARRSSRGSSSSTASSAWAPQWCLPTSRPRRRGGRS